MHSTLTEKSYRHIRDLLVDGELQPGDRLVTRVLAEKIGVSLAPVREAIFRLSSEGLVEHVPGAGAFVRTPQAQDLEELYVLREAVENGQTVHPRVKLFIQAGSQEVQEHCREQGHIDVFEKVGATFIEPSCGACINAGPGVSYDPDQVTISAINRNFPGRSGPGQLYLVSPYSVAASALAGFVTQWEPGKTIEPIPPRKLAVV